MMHITFKRSPFPCISVRLNIFPPDILFNILVVACPTLRFLVLSLTAIPMNRAVALRDGSRKLFQTVCVPLKIFVAYFLLIHLRAYNDVV